MIMKRKRKELYDKFRQGSIPSGADFADFIRSQLNLLDDGINVSDDPDDPICLMAHGEEENLLDFADEEGDKRWRISGRNQEGDKEGFHISAEEKSKLYIERDTGNIGIGIDNPLSKLHIKQIGPNDALRIDDEGNDETPFVVTSDGKVGIGIGNADERPNAKLHINSPLSGPAFRVDDTAGDTTPFIITEDGNVGIGVDNPESKLTIMGNVAIGGEPEKQLMDNSLYIKGNLEVEGDLILSGETGVGGIEVNGPLSSPTDLLEIRDNVTITAGTNKVSGGNSDGSLSVEGDTVLGSYGQDNTTTINGKIQSGGVPNSADEQQWELEINEILKVNRNTNDELVTVAGNTKLGRTQSDTVNINGIVTSDNAQINVDKKAVFQGDVEIQGRMIGGVPVGTILMYDGANWQDNVTLPGWYACISSNSSHGCPDLVDRFIMGGATAGALGGNNLTTLTTANIPAHNHNFVVDSVTGGGHLTLATGGVSNVTTSKAGNHYHKYSRPNSSTERSRCECTRMLKNSFGSYNTSSAGSHSHTFSLSSHQHFVEDHSHTIDAHIENTGQGQSFDNRSAYYQVIFIRRCS